MRYTRSSRPFSRLLSFTVVIFTLWAFPLHALPDSLGADFETLRSYEPGDSEAPLRRIAEALRSAGAADVESRTALEQALIAVLDPETTMEGRRFAARMLGEIAGADGAAALGEQLAVPALFHSALTALEQNPHAAAMSAMTGALATADAPQQIALLSALGRQGKHEAIPEIAACLSHDHHVVQTAASQALAAMGTADACGHVLEAFHDGDASLRLLLADALLTCARPLLDGETKTLITAALQELGAAPYPAHIRLGATLALADAFSDQAQALLLALLRDEDRRLAADALMMAREMTGPLVTEALVLMFEEVKDAHKAPLLEVLGDRGDVLALPAVRTHADHENPEVRRAALRATGQLGDATLTRFLLERASSGPMDEQRIAREAIAQMAGTTINTRLLDLAKGGSPEEQRTRAIALLAERRATETARDLYRLAGTAGIDTPDAVPVAAIVALRTLAPPAMLDELILLAGHPAADRIRSVLPQTIAEVAFRKQQERPRDGRWHDTGDAALPIVGFLDALDTHQPDFMNVTPAHLAATQVTLLESLALVGTDAAFDAARKALDAQDVEVRRAGINALSRFQRTDALDELLVFINAETDPEVRALAYSTYLGALRNAGSLPRSEVDAHLAHAYDHARTTAARRDFLATASRLPSLRSLQLIESLLNEEDIIAESVRAALSVAKALSGAFPAEARARLEWIAGLDHTPALVEEAQQALAFMDTFDNHLMAWEMAGPYYQENVMAHALFDHTFPPETEPEQANWRIFPVLTDAQPPFALEIDRVIGGDERVLFLRSFIESPADKDAILELGTNDGCRVWWNGELVHSLNVGRALTPGEDLLPVQLNRGMNTIMIAVFQHGAAWRATARLVDQEGRPLENLNIRPAHPDAE